MNLWQSASDEKATAHAPTFACQNGSDWLLKNLETRQPDQEQVQLKCAAVQREKLGSTKN